MTIQEQYTALLELALAKDIDVTIRHGKSKTLGNVLRITSETVFVFDQVLGEDSSIPLASIKSLEF
jgi:hypothetical protein